VDEQPGTVKIGELARRAFLQAHTTGVDGGATDWRAHAPDRLAYALDLLGTAEDRLLLCLGGAHNAVGGPVPLAGGLRDQREATQGDRPGTAGGGLDLLEGEAIGPACFLHDPVGGRVIMCSQLAHGSYIHLLGPLRQTAELRHHLVQTQESDLLYDYLILATGAHYNYFGHDEWMTFAPGLHSADAADLIRGKILRAFEDTERLATNGQADPDTLQELLTFILVGGGTAGVEMAGTIAEMARMALAHDFRHIDPRSARILLDRICEPAASHDPVGALVSDETSGGAHLESAAATS